MYLKYLIPKLASKVTSGATLRLFGGSLICYCHISNFKVPVTEDQYLWGYVGLG